MCHAVLSILFLLFIFAFSCKKNTPQNNECVIPAVVPFQPYSDPVWHPNGELLGFNHTPLINIRSNGASPCIWYSYLARADSTGFYLMKKDGTGFKRVTKFTLSAPAWSPDGKWVAFSLGSNLYKMPFNGSSFDTSQIIQLTTSGGNFYPSWTANSDTIYFDSNNDAPAGTSFYSIWKMASNGTGKNRMTQSAGVGDGRQPFVGSNKKIYYVGFANAIFSMDNNGLDIYQITFTGINSLGNRPKYRQGKVFYEGDGIRTIPSSGGADKQLDSPCITYDISSSGEIVFSKMYYDITKFNKQIGTLWIMNADGSNKRQLTFNNY